MTASSPFIKSQLISNSAFMDAAEMEWFGTPYVGDTVTFHSQSGEQPAIVRWLIGEEGLAGLQAPNGQRLNFTDFSLEAKEGTKPGQWSRGWPTAHAREGKL